MVNPNFYADMVEANYSTIPHVPYKEQIASFVGACLTSIEAGIQNMHGLLPDYDQRKQKLGADLQRYGSDAWGNVRIPKLELLPSYDMERPNEWVNVLYNDELVNYASLIGLTVDDVPQDTVGNISWEMGAAYHNFKVRRVVGT
jgi:hypothetical protein